mmetsp:Transcript_36327/g.73888  ORF Transcript_36327/g.73888 Transcript_36327/m.73888 type:complete len:211 (+) Transcript_36327:503-1135(+)
MCVSCSRRPTATTPTSCLRAWATLKLTMRMGLTAVWFLGTATQQCASGRLIKTMTNTRMAGSRALSMDGAAKQIRSTRTMAKFAWLRGEIVLFAKSQLLPPHRHRGRLHFPRQFLFPQHHPPPCPHHHRPRHLQVPNRHSTRHHLQVGHQRLNQQLVILLRYRQLCPRKSQRWRRDQIRCFLVLIPDGSRWSRNRAKILSASSGTTLGRV